MWQNICNAAEAALRVEADPIAFTESAPRAAAEVPWALMTRGAARRAEATAAQAVDTQEGSDRHASAGASATTAAIPQPPAVEPPTPPAVHAVAAPAPQLPVPQQTPREPPPLPSLALIATHSTDTAVIAEAARHGFTRDAAGLLVRAQGDGMEIFIP